MSKQMSKTNAKRSTHHVSEEGHHDGDDAGDAHVGGPDDEALHTQQKGRRAGG
jgi:hypothetical protein